MFSLFKCEGHRIEYDPYPSRIINGVNSTDGYNVSRWNVAQRRKLSSIVPSLGYGCCKSCFLPWWVVQYHAVDYSENGAGFFAACESCFRDLNADELLPHYEAALKLAYPDRPDYLEYLRNSLHASKPFRSIPAAMRERTE